MNEYVPIVDGLKNLYIQKDLNDEDSDVTPTNSSPTTLTSHALKPMQLPPSSNTSGFYECDFVRYSSCDEYDMRSNSSLSWGEDEFEGEATRIVNALFDQLDKILYNEDSIVKSIVVPASLVYPNNTSFEERKKKIKKPSLTDPTKSPKFHQLNIERQFSLVNNQSITEDDANESFNIGGVSIPEPSATLKSECKEWTTNFPHFRITGIGVDIQQLSKLELLVFEEEQKSQSVEDEAIIAQDGEYEGKLQYVTLKREVNAEKKDHHRKTKGPPSRICSGSSDPEVLKEQILIKLFDFLWPTVTQVVEPLLNQYAHFVISQSVQYSSISRESSTKGYREGYHSYTSQHSTNIPPIFRRADRPVSAGIRSPSPIFKLPSKVLTENASKEELQKLLQISSKPILYPDNRRNIRSMSASKVIDVSPSQTTVVSLPILLNHRPVSSKSTNHLLTPRLKTDQRPTSNSSLARLRFNDKYNSLNKSATIDEDKTYDKDHGIRNREEEIGSPSPTWSRHTSFLPPISDVATFVQGKGKGQPRFKGDVQHEASHSVLSVKGKSLSATSRNSNTAPYCPQNEIAKSTSPAEPFVSWVVSKVEQHSNTKLSSPVSQHIVDNKTKHSTISKNKYYKRATHH